MTARPALPEAAASSPSPRLAELCTRLLHPDILLPILSHLAPTHLPALFRSSRYLHTLSGPLLYTDLSIPSLTPSALCPHLSPIASLFPPGASRSDLRTILSGDRVCRKRVLLEHARTLRVGYHTHCTLPVGLDDLRLDMTRVDTLYIQGGNAICHHLSCPIFRNLAPRIVILESASLALDRIGGLSSSPLTTASRGEGIDHLVVKLRPPNFSMYPTIDGGPLPLLRSARKITIIFTPNTYTDRKGGTVSEPWIPTSRSVCGDFYWTARPSFADLLKHVWECTRGIEEVVLVGAEVLDRQWVGVEHDETCCVHARKEGWLGREMHRVTREMRAREEGGEGGTEGMQSQQCMSFFSRAKWDIGPDGALLDPPPISAGYKGKGVGNKRPALVHKAITV